TISCSRRFGSCIMLHSAKKSIRLVVANILAGPGIGMLAGITCCNSFFNDPAFVNRIGAGAGIGYAKIFFAGYGLWYWWYCIWYCDKICGFFTDLCYCIRYQLRT